MEWCDDTIARLRSLWDEGHSTAEIGRRLGVTKNAVVGKAHRLVLPSRPSPIRREPGSMPSRPPVQRRPCVTGPTLPPLATAVPEAVQPVADNPPAPAASPERPPVTLRPLPAAPRPPARRSACCWPIGEPGTREFHFCDADALGGKPYCAEHAKLAYVKVRDRREDAA